MMNRYLNAFVVLAVAPLLLVSLPAASQAQTYTTAWGDPDLQGIWTNVTITPLQRPVDFAGKEVLTEEEAAAFEQVTAESRVDGPPRAGNPGTYNEHWFDRGTKVVGDRRTSLIIDPPDGRIPWRAEALEANANRDQGRGRDYWNSHNDLDTGERCITDGMPHVPWVYNNNYQIFQAPGYMAIIHEQYNELRIIPLDGRPHLEDIDQWFGDSRGHWEGDTLVVETTNFSDRRSDRWANDWRIPRPTLHFVERFRRVDAKTIDYRFTVTDPTTFTQPWTVVAPMSGDQEAMGATVGRLFEYACHEGNHAVANVLAGARAQEKADSGTTTGSR